MSPQAGFMSPPKKVFAVLIFGILLFLGFSWFFAQVESQYPWFGRYPETDPDAMLYFRWLEQSLLQGKRLEVDTYSSFPFDYQIRLAPLPLDLYYHLATWIFVLFPGFSGSPEEVLGVLPPILGTLIIFFILWFSWKRSKSVGLTACIAFACIPQNWQIGTNRYMLLDHHFLEVFWIWAWLFLTWRFLETSGGWNLIGAGVACAGLLLSWVAAPLFFFLVMVYCLVSGFLERAWLGRLLEISGDGMLIGSGLVGLYVWLNPERCGSTGLSDFGWVQPSMVGLAGILLRGFFWFEARWKGSGRRITIFFLTSVLVLSGILLMVFPRPFLEARDFLFRKDPVVASIGETQPMAHLGGGPIGWSSIFGIVKNLGILSFFFPLVLFLSPKRIFHEEGAFFRDWCFVFVLMTACQLRFGRWLNAGSGLINGVILFEIFQFYRSRLSRDWEVGKLCLVFLPLMLVHNGWSFEAVSGRTGGDQTQSEALEWLRQNSPATSGYSDAGKPEYGVLSFWDRGNMIAYYSQRPVVVGNNIIGIRRMAEIFASTDEEQAFESCKKYGVKYIYLPASMSEERNFGTMHQILEAIPENQAHYSIFDGFTPKNCTPYHSSLHSWLMMFQGVKPNENFKKPSSHFRMIYSSKVTPFEPFPEVTIFEVVRGAVIKGSADPGTFVEISLPMKVDSVKTGYRGIRAVETDGTFEFRVPYATGTKKGRIITNQYVGLHFFRKGEEQNPLLEISEDDVQEGGSIKVP